MNPVEVNQESDPGQPKPIQVLAQFSMAPFLPPNGQLSQITQPMKWIQLQTINQPEQKTWELIRTVREKPGK